MVESIYNALQKDRATFLETSRETRGERTLLEVELAPGGGNALHFHSAFSERFEAQRGTLQVQVGKETRALRPGESALVRPGLLHRFFNPTSEAVTFRVELHPGSEGFENALRVGYGLANDGRTNSNGIPKSLLDLAVLVSMAETHPAGPARLIIGFLAFVARTGAGRRRAEKLLRRYAGPRSVAA